MSNKAAVISQFETILNIYIWQVLQKCKILLACQVENWQREEGKCKICTLKIQYLRWDGTNKFFQALQAIMSLNSILYVGLQKN